jgi:hypothetical protein
VVYAIVCLSVRSVLMNSWLLKPPDLGEMPHHLAEARFHSLLVVRCWSWDSLAPEIERWE